jgi:hypothetical protein
MAHMKVPRLNRKTLLARLFVIGAALIPLATARLHACTIFVLTDTNRTLFCNNEDWESTKTRIWFVPSSAKHHGGVYVGFDNDFAQGGMNTEGLAFDWVAGYAENWKPDPNVPLVYGNSGQDALENCATVEEAIKYFKGHQDRQFYRAKVLIADRSGASVIIGGKDGRLEVEEATQCRGFGYGQPTLDKMLTRTTAPTVTNGFKILRAAAQKGQYATRYSNIFDLKNVDIFLYPFPGLDGEVKFNLAAELKKGGHYYDMPEIQKQLSQPARPLLATMERLRLDKYQPIPDEPTVTTHVRAMLQNAMDGTMRADDFAPELWKTESPKQKETAEMVKAFGGVRSVTLVDRSADGGQTSYRYRLEFEKNTLLQRFVFNEQNKLAASSTEEIQ